MRACDYHVYKYTFDMVYHERVPTYGGMDSEPTGRMLTKESTYIIVAPDQELADALFKRKMLYPNSAYTWKSCEHIGQCDQLMYLQ